MDDAHGTNDATERRRRALALRTLARQRLRPGAAARSPAVEEALRTFGSERALLLAVHQRWQVRLLARLDQVLEQGSGDLHDDVLRAVTEQSRAMPGFAALLREHAHDPALALAHQRLADYVEQACPCGRSHPLVEPARPRRAPARSMALRAITRARRRCPLACRVLA
jgi:hypothetical protein